MTTADQASAVASVIASLSAPIFCAGPDGNHPLHLTLHVADANRQRGLGGEAEASLARAGIRARCRVRALRHRRLARAKSLREVVRPFGAATPLYDPTGSVTRAQALLRCGALLQRLLGDALRASLLDPETRTLYLLVREETLSVAGGGIDEARRRGLEARALAAITQWRREDGGAFDLAFRLCLQLPALPLLPLDARSLAAAGRRPGWPARLRAGMIIGGLATLFGATLSSPALADDLPAVSDVNAKASVEGGDAERHTAGFFNGSFAVPLGHSFGAQADGFVGALHGQEAWGVSGQAFWRDPEIGLIGGFASHQKRDDFDLQVQRYGGEGELYLGEFTVDLAGGYQGGDVGHGGFQRVDLSWYPLDDFKLTGGVDHAPQRTMGLAGAEYQLGLSTLPGLSVFAEAGVKGSGIGGSGLDHALAGFRYYFGETKTLIRRHREDDPQALSADPLWTVASSPHHNTSTNTTPYGGQTKRPPLQ